MPPEIRLQEYVGRTFVALMCYGNSRLIGAAIGAPIRPVFGAHDAWSIGFMILQLLTTM